MKIFVLTKWEYVVVNGNLGNCFQDAQLYSDFNVASSAMLSSMAEKFNTLFSEGSNPCMSINPKWGIIHAMVHGKNGYFRYQIFERELM